MPITMEHVLNELRRDEPDFAQAARLGQEALPYLLILLQGSNVGLAAKAAFLAGAINAEGSPAILEIASKHPEPVVRVAAAAATRSLTQLPLALAIAY